MHPENIFSLLESEINFPKEICPPIGEESSDLEDVIPLELTIGLDDDEILGSIRFSFSRFNTIEEADYCVDVLKETVAFLRRFNRKR